MPLPPRPSQSPDPFSLKSHDHECTGGEEMVGRSSFRCLGTEALGQRNGFLLSVLYYIKCISKLEILRKVYYLLLHLFINLFFINLEKNSCTYETVKN